MVTQLRGDWWRTWFGPHYLDVYDDYLKERTPVEVDQIEALLRLSPGSAILDLGCGQGRHVIELAQRGYRVTGLDLSPYLLSVARERATAAGVTAEWVEADMRQAPRDRAYDLVLSLFTSFGYFEDDADNDAVLRAVVDALAPGGRMLLEILNGDRAVKQFREREWFPVGQLTVLEERTLDPRRNRLTVRRTVVRSGERETSYHSIRLYRGPEIRQRLRAAGFTEVRLLGDWDGSPLRDQSDRIIAVSQKPI